MKTNRWLQWSVVAATVILASACANEGPVAPTASGAVATSEQEADDAATQLAAKSSHDRRLPDLGKCSNLAAPAGSKLSLRTYAAGVQIYRWDGASWVFVAPSALLFADAGKHGIVGVHFAGPTWQSRSGSKVVAGVADRCTVSANAIPWLSLAATESGGPGIFRGVTFIQRLFTTGGLTPAVAGRFVGDEARVPYTAEYLFYRTKQAGEH